MAAVPKQIALCLTNAMKEKDPRLLHSAFKSLKELVDESVIVDRGRTFDVPYDLYLFTCETALFFSEFEAARECLKRLLECPTSTKSYQIRTLFCRAVMDSYDARGLRGSALVESAQAALAKIMRGIRMALQDPPRLSHLVVSGSQHFWNVGRVLYKEGSFGDMVNSIGAIVSALEKIDYADWKVRNTWLLRHATALAGCGRAAEANTVLTKAADLVAKYTPAMKYPVFRMQIALSKIVANPKVKQDAAKGVLRGLFASQGLFCGLLDGAAAESEVVGAYNELSQELKIEMEQQARAREATSPSPPKGQAPPVPAPPAQKKGAADTSVAASSEDVLFREEILAELGLALALLTITDKASEAATRSLQSKRLRPRVFGEYTQALLIAIECGGMRVQSEMCANFCTSHVVQELTNAVRRLERSLESAVRIPDVSDRNHVVQMGAVLMWNIALPLLQTRTRAAISKPLQSAVKLLDDIGSNMNYLRALLHYETSLVDFDSEYLNKASSRVATALGIDYIPDPEDAKLYALERPLDRFLVWMKQRVQIKSNLYMHPDNPEDEALLILEQTRDAPLLSKLSTLGRVNTILLGSEPPVAPGTSELADTLQTSQKVDPKAAKAAPKAKAKQSETTEEADKPDPEAEKKRQLLRTRGQLWHMLLQLGWVEKARAQIPVVRSAAEHLLCRQWQRRGDRDMRIMQADAHTKLAEVEVVELEAKNLKLTQKSFMDEIEAESDSDEEEIALGESAELDAATLKIVAEKGAAVDAAQKAVQAHLLKAAQIGVELCTQQWEDQWLVINAATTLWNFFVDGFAENDFISPAKALEGLYTMLIGINLNALKEATLLRDISFAYVRSLLQQFILEKQGLDSSIPNLLRVMGTDFHSFRTVDAAHPKLQRAAEVCEKMIGMLPTAMDALPFCMASVNIRRMQGKPPETRQNVQLRIMTILDQLDNPAATVEEKRSLLNTAGELLPQDPNVELCARVAEKCVAVPGCERLAVRVSVIAQNLYDSGKLGIRQADAPQAAPIKASDKKDAKQKPGQAAAPTESSTAAVEPPPPPDAECWTWFSLLMQYRSLGIVQLINPSVQDKPTQYEVRRQALVALTNSAAAAFNGLPQFRSQIILKAHRHYRCICQEFAAEAATRLFAYPTLRIILSERIMSAVTISPARATADRDSDADVLGGLFLFLLRCIRDQNAIDEGLKVMKLAIGMLPPSHHKPFWDLDVQLRCQAGVPTNQTLLRVKEYNAETQARVWLTVARFSKDPKDQLFAYQSAISVLQSQPVEKAKHLLAMVQWMLESNHDISVDALRQLILSSIDLLSEVTDLEIDEEQSTGGHDMQSTADARSRRGAGDDMTERRSSFRGELGSLGRRSSVKNLRKRERGPRTSVAHLSTIIRAYHLLAQIGAFDAVCVGVPVDSGSCLALVAHYILRLWSITVGAANAHVKRQRAEKARNEAKIAALEHNAAATVADHDKKKKAAVTLPPPTAAATPQMLSAATAAEPEQQIAIPTVAHGWFGYRPPALLISTLKSMKSNFAVSAGSVESPDDFLSVLSDVVERMLREGCDIFVPATLSMMKLIADVCFPSGPVQQTASNLFSMMLYNVSRLAGNGAVASLYYVDAPFVASSDRVALAEDAKMVAKLRSTAAQMEVGGRVYTPSSHTRRIDRYWVAQCEQLLLEGRISSAREILRDTVLHAEAHGDNETIARCRFVQSRIDMLEGNFASALQILQEAQEVSPFLDVRRWSDMKLFEAELLLNLSQTDDAMAVEPQYQRQIAQKFEGCTKLHLDLSKAMLPELQCHFSLRFASLVMHHFAKRPDVQSMPPGPTLNSLVSILNGATERAASIPSLHAAVNQAAFDLGLYEIALNRHRPTIEVKQLFLSESSLLFGVIKDVSESLLQYNGSAETKALAVYTSRHIALAKAFCSLGDNIIARVRLNARLVDEYRSSMKTEVGFPSMPGAPQSLEPEIVQFMRNTKKQREANERRKERSKARQLVEERRAAARREKMAELERRREQRKQEELASGKPAPKRGPSKPSDKVETEPEVAPDDKCGIESPPVSEDDGIGEDSQSEDEAEKNTAFGGNASAAEMKRSYADALNAFRNAQDCLAGDSHFLQSQVHLGIGRALWLIHESGLVGHEQRRSTFLGEKPPPVEQSARVAAKWHLPLDAAASVPTAEEETKKPVKGAKEDKKAPGKAQASTPTPDASQQKAQADGNKMHWKPPLLLEASTVLEKCIAHCHAEAEESLLLKALIQYASVRVARGHMNTAARAIECAHATVVSRYVTHLWALASYPDSQELCVARTVEYVQRCSPHLCSTPHFAAIHRSKYANSKMFSRLTLPSTAIAFEPPAEHAHQEDPHTPGLAPDITVLTMVIHEDDYLYMVLRRPNGLVGLRRFQFAFTETTGVEQLAGSFARLMLRKTALLSSENSAATPQGMDSIEEEYGALLTELNEFFVPFLSPFAGVLDSLAAKCHLLLCIDPTLLPLPLEALQQFSKFRSVARELSYHNAAAKISRRQADKYSAGNASFIVDAHYEGRGMAKNIFSDEKAKMAGWSTLTCTLDDKHFLRPISVSSMQRALINPSNATAVFCSFGRLCNTISLADLSGLSLDHLRLFACIDRGCNAASTRRENQNNMSKLPHIQWAEAPWNVAMLMLARGVECCLAQSGPVSGDACLGIGKLVVSSLEKGPKHFGEMLRSALRQGPAAMEKSQNPPAKGAAEQKADEAPKLNLRGTDRDNVVVYGISPADEAIGAPEKTAKR